MRCIEKNFARSIAIAVLALASASAWAVKPFTADYAASYKGVTANATMTLASAGGNKYTYTLSIKSPMATLVQSTTFEDNGGKWRPLSGSDSSQVLIKKSVKKASYDWAAGEARWSGDVKADRVGPVALQAGDLDAMLLNLAIARDGTAGKSVSYRMVDNGKATRMTYQVLGREDVTVGGKVENAVKLSRTDGNKQILVWVVEGLPVPARIVQRKDGSDEMDLRLKGLN